MTRGRYPSIRCQICNIPFRVSRCPLEVAGVGLQASASCLSLPTRLADSARRPCRAVPKRAQTIARIGIVGSVQLPPLDKEETRRAAGFLGWRWRESTLRSARSSRLPAGRGVRSAPVLGRGRLRSSPARSYAVANARSTPPLETKPPPSRVERRRLLEVAGVERNSIQSNKMQDSAKSQARKGIVNQGFGIQMHPSASLCIDFHDVLLSNLLQVQYIIRRAPTLGPRRTRNDGSRKGTRVPSPWVPSVDPGDRIGRDRCQGRGLLRPAVRTPS